MNRQDFITHCIAFLLGAMIFIVGSMTTEDLNRERDLYCEMVQLYDSTEGEYGWPDYRNARGECP